MSSLGSPAMHEDMSSVEMTMPKMLEEEPIEISSVVFFSAIVFRLASVYFPSISFSSLGFR
jgi:hypothetical protein